MRGKLAAAAAGVLFLAPSAHAQIVFGNPQFGTLQVYGRLYPQFGYGSSKDPSLPGTQVSTLASVSGTVPAVPAVSTPGSRRAIDTQDSYIGFRGERDIASRRLKFIWQLEQAVRFDTGDATWSNRNSFLGVRSEWGTVRLGNIDTIYKQYGDTLQMFGIASNNFVSASHVLSQIGVGPNTAARFHERKANSIQYETPQWNGFTAGYQYSPDERRDTQNLPAAPGPACPPGTCGRDASLHSYGIKWDSGKWYFSLHQEKHQDFFGASSNIDPAISNLNTQGAHSRDTGTRFSAEWRYLPNQRLTFDGARLKYHEYGQAAAGMFETYQHTNWALGWEGGPAGPWAFAAQYVRGGEGQCRLTGSSVCSANGLQSYMITTGARYRFDRQTFAYAIAAKLNNGPSARYDNWAAVDPARGADILQVALGLSYSF